MELFRFLDTALRECTATITFRERQAALHMPRASDINIIRARDAGLHWRAGRNGHMVHGVPGLLGRCYVGRGRGHGPLLVEAHYIGSQYCLNRSGRAKKREREQTIHKASLTLVGLNILARYTCK